MASFSTDDVERALAVPVRDPVFQTCCRGTPTHLNGYPAGTESSCTRVTFRSLSAFLIHDERLFAHDAGRWLRSHGSRGRLSGHLRPSPGDPGSVTFGYNNRDQNDVKWPAPA
jgi:hypothetical protein